VEESPAQTTWILQLFLKEGAEQARKEALCKPPIWNLAK
jgi:hypothetical protein